MKSALERWLERIERLHPNAIELGLERVRLVAQRMHLTRPAPTVVTVGGTNGKGSCVTFIEAILRTAGLRTGAYFSPHLLRYNERVRILGEEAGDAELVAGFEAVESARGSVSLTYFEFGTLAALWLMQRADLDAAVLEVGLGGRLDAVNLVDADVAVLSSIDIDHQEWLGNSRELIGREKAGIMRPGRPVICGDPAPPASVLEAASALGAPLYVLGRDFEYRRERGGWSWRGVRTRHAELPLPALPGAFQLGNAATALTAIEQLSCAVRAEDLAAGLRAATLGGRLQHADAAGVQWVFDVGHNAQAGGVLAQELAARPAAGRSYAVIGMMRDKQVEEYVARLQASVQSWITASLPPPRGLGAEELAQRIEQALRVPVSRAGTVAEACARAAAFAVAGDRVVVCGSFQTVGPALAARGLYSQPGPRSTAASGT